MSTGYPCSFAVALRKQRIADYLILGTNIRFLMDVSEGTTVHGNAVVTGNLQETVRLLGTLGLPVSERLFVVFGLARLLRELEALEEDARLDADQAAALTQQAQQLRETAIAEAVGLYAYVTSDKRLDVAKLTDDPAALFPRGVYNQLSEMARTDIAEGFKCIAFERSTAAAFHLMRSVEESLRCFYLATVKRQRVHPLLWKAMTDQLGKRRNPPPAALLAQLDHIRANFRNPTQHPEAVYDIDEAQDLAFLAIDVSTRLIRALP